MAVVDTDPSEFLKHHQQELVRVIVSAGIQNVADKCEQLDLLKVDEKERILNEATGKLDKDRASMLLKNIRALFIKSDEDSDAATLDKFMCVLLEKCNGSVRQSIIGIARYFGKALPRFTELAAKPELISTNNDDEGDMEISYALMNLHPGQDLTVGSLYDALKDFNKWEQFGRKLPRVSHSDIERIQLENRGDINAQKTALFDKWLRADANASWSTVIRALEAVDEGRLARKIMLRLGLDPSYYGNSSSSSSSVINSKQKGAIPPTSGFPVATPSITTPTMTTPPTERPDHALDSKLILDKIPTHMDVMTVLSPDDINHAQFRKVLGVPADISPSEAISRWIREEPSDVTWRTICRGLKESNKRGVARALITEFLKLPSVYERYSKMKNYDSEIDGLL